MTTEQLPDGLQLAVELLDGDRDAFVVCHRHPIHGLEPADAEIAGEYLGAIHAIRNEHTQRLTLQHHAADQAQRIADLEAKCDTLKRLHDAAADERDALRSANADLHSQVAYWHRKAVETRNEGSEIERQLSGQLDVASNELRLVMVERDALRAQISACTPHLRERPDGTLESPADMLALRKREVLGLLGRLAEIEAQEPVAWMREIDAEWLAVRGCMTVSGECNGGWRSPLYGRPVPAQAVPDGWRLVQVKSAEFDSLMYWLGRCDDKGHLENCPDLIDPWANFDYRYVATAPEHKA